MLTSHLVLALRSALSGKPLGIVYLCRKRLVRGRRVLTTLLRLLAPVSSRRFMRTASIFDVRRHVRHASRRQGVFKVSPHPPSLPSQDNGCEGHSQDGRSLLTAYIALAEPLAASNPHPVYTVFHDS